jgi:superfamily II DNA/RNA helicase
MRNKAKSRIQILKKLGIDNLTDMQKAAILAIEENHNVILQSPTGSGKTLAFLLPLIEDIDLGLHEVQAMVLVPSRELAIQIEQSAREMGSGLKINAVYGGRYIYKDKTDLTHAPHILIGTPGRIADHFRRETVDTSKIRFLVIDEFDKCLEIGFEGEIKEIVNLLAHTQKRILTSATSNISIPDFLQMNDPIHLDFSNTMKDRIGIKLIRSSSKDKLETLFQTLCNLEDQIGIVFCNFKDSIYSISDYLSEKGIHHVEYHGDLEQRDREIVLTKFRNGSIRTIIATDLAARGLDIPAIDYIIHYQLPVKSEEFIHRNGRTARMLNKGTAYVLKWSRERLSDFIICDGVFELQNANLPSQPLWRTVAISAGRKERISKGDVLGFCVKQCEIAPYKIGIIELRQDVTYVAVHSDEAKEMVSKGNNQKLKKIKVRLLIV